MRQGGIRGYGKNRRRNYEEAKGDGGFGYDPLFYSYELKTGFGQATAEQKNMVSHRGKALRNLLKIIEDENL